MFFYRFLCSGTPDFVLGILKMPIRVYFRDVIQKQSNNLFLA